MSWQGWMSSEAQHSTAQLSPSEEVAVLALLVVAVGEIWPQPYCSTTESASGKQNQPV